MPISNGVKNLIKKFIPPFLLDWYHFILSLFGAIFYCFPSKKLKVIGVTGTKGKSTVVELVSEILESAGYKIASLSSIKFKIGEKEWPNTLKMTMPGRFKLQKFLRQAVKAGCQYAVLEITSEGIKQHRHRFIDFDGAVFTNLTPEHIEAHGGFENYKKAKGKLFQTVEKSKKKNLSRDSAKGRILRDKFSVINMDDQNAEYFLNFNTGRKYTYAINNKNAEITPEKVNLRIQLLGEFNIYNSLAAYCVGLSQNIEPDKILKVLESAKGIPGRMELVIEKPFKVFVDYAHTPDSLEKVYKTIKQLQATRYKLQAKLICVFGSCGGGRDKWKRPEMGKIAAEYCDKIILTNEDPYDENPSQILSEIKSGIPDTKYQILNTIIDRREAINKALSSARLNDVVIITGKGCEQYIRIEKGRTIPWDDRKIVKEEFDKISPHY